MQQPSLTSVLWDAANTLRGSAVDRTDWKGYILPLLFFKRICDVWDEETAEATETFGDVDPALFPEVHRFEVPDGCHWRDIRETPANVGAALLKAMQAIERANPDTLYRVFGTADWGNWYRFRRQSVVPFGRQLTIVRRRITKRSPFRVRAQMCVNPRKSNVSHFPVPCWRCRSEARRPNSISRVFCG